MKVQGFPLCTFCPFTDKSIDFERHVKAPEIWLVLTIGVDPRGYFLGGFNLFELAERCLDLGVEVESARAFLQYSCLAILFDKKIVRL